MEATCHALRRGSAVAYPSMTRFQSGTVRAYDGAAATRHVIALVERAEKHALAPAQTGGAHGRVAAAAHGTERQGPDQDREATEGEGAGRVQRVGRVGEDGSVGELR